MIHVDLWFGPGPEKLKAVAAALFALPDDPRPTRRSESQNSIGKPIGDIDRFVESLATGLVPILKRRGVQYVIFAPDGRPIQCWCKFATAPSRAEELLERMAAANPVFGYACVWEEPLHRNQIKTKVRWGRSVSGSLTFRGRNPAKCVPGLLAHAGFRNPWRRGTECRSRH